MSNNSSLCALVARRDALEDWLADYTAKLNAGIALTELERYEYEYLLGKKAKLARDVVAALHNKPLRKWSKFIKAYLQN